MNSVIYTSIIGDIDILGPVPNISRHIRHVAFVDKIKSNSPGWEQILVTTDWNNRRTSRHYKALPHRYLPDADLWIWVDGNVRFRVDPLPIIKRYMTNDLTTFKHWDRSCLYVEAAFCVKIHKDSLTTLKAQARRYRKAGMPSNWGLAATRVMIRRNTPAIHELNEAWWAEIEHGSFRDQVSLPYVCWKHNLRWKVLPGRCVLGGKGAFLYVRHVRRSS